MTLNEFIDQEKSKLDEFKEFWEERNVLVPDNFPLDMNPGDWDEQYHFWSDNEI